MGIPDHIICFLINLYAGQKPTVRTGHGTMDWFKTGKGVQQGCILSPACTCVLSPVRLFVTLWTVAHQTPLSMGFWGKDTGVDCHLLLQQIFWFQELNPYLLCLQHWQADSFTTEPPGMPKVRYPHQKKKKSPEHLRSMGGYAHQLGLCPAGYGVPGSSPHTATVTSLLFPEYPASPYLWTVASATPSSWCLSPGVPMVVLSSLGDLPTVLLEALSPPPPL